MKNLILEIIDRKKAEIKTNLALLESEKRHSVKKFLIESINILEEQIEEYKLILKSSI